MYPQLQSTAAGPRAEAYHPHRRTPDRYASAEELDVHSFLGEAQYSSEEHVPDLYGYCLTLLDG